MVIKNVCGAKTRNGTPCQRAPMENGRCYLHGGKTPRGVASPHFKHGRYSRYARVELAEKLDTLGTDRALMSLRREIALITAIIQNKVYEYDENDTAHGWTAARRQIKRARKSVKRGELGDALDALDALEDIADGVKMRFDSIRDITRTIDTRRKLVDAELKHIHAAKQMITAEQAAVMVERMLAAVRDNVTDRAALDAIQAEFVAAVQMVRTR